MRDTDQVSAASDQDPTRAYLGSLNRLRGVAALCVVAGHAFNVRALMPAQDLLRPAFLLVSSGTILFVLIAGVLYRQRAVPRLVSGQATGIGMLKRRWAELAGVYLGIGAIFAGLISYNRHLHFGEAFWPNFAKMMVNGSMSYSYWYVPFFLVLMAIYPLHLWFCRQRLPIQTGMITGGLTLGILLHRPDSSSYLAVLHSMLYYLPVFWVGLTVGRDWENVLARLRNMEIPLGALVACVIAVQIAIGQKSVLLHPIGEMWGSLDLFAIQKIALAALLIVGFERLHERSMPLIDWCARNSLAIFFMHSPVLSLLSGMPNYSGIYVPELTLLTFVMLYFGVRLDRSLRAIFTRKARP